MDATNAAPAPPERRWWQDRPGHLLWWTGVAAGAGGAALLITGNYRVSDAPGRATYGAYLEARDGGRTLQQAGAAVLGVGGALACAGLIRFIYAGTTTGRRGHATPDTTTITATVGAGAAGLAIHGAF
jgi:hypothetical protein